MLNSTSVGRGRSRARRAAFAMSTILCSGFAAPSIAQVATPAPVRSNIDANGVDLFLGTMNVDGPTLSAGDGEKQGLTWRKMARGTSGWGDTLVGTLVVSGSTTYLSFGEKTYRFTLSGTMYTSTEQEGATLTKNGTTYTFTAGDGTVATFTSSYVGAYPYGNVQGNVTTVRKPNGATFTYTYDSAAYCASQKSGSDGYICTQHRNAYRVSSITSNANYRLDFRYDNWSGGFEYDEIPQSTDWVGWGDVTSVVLSNTASSGSGRTQSFTSSYSNGSWYLNITDALGQITTYRSLSQGLAGIKLPGSTSEDVVIGYDSSGRVNSVATAAGATTYSYTPDSGNNRTVTVTDPLGRATTYVFDIAQQRMLQRTLPAPISKTTRWAYDSSGRVTRVTAPEGNYTSYVYDGRGNATETHLVAKPGSGPAEIVTFANYDPSCASVAKCNSPNWTRDARGNQTDYSYDSATGNLQTVQQPAAVANGVRPTTSYSYTSVNGISMLSGVSVCASAATCDNTANQTKTTIGYNANGLPTSVTTAAGDNSISATVTAAYDDAGNKIVQTDALGNDTRYRYDANRQLLGVISPDPDGAGTLVRKAQKNSYDPKGRVVVAAVGTVTDSSDTAWSNFTETSRQTTNYDAAGRAVRRATSAGGTTYAVTDAIYDANNHQTCAIQYMDLANVGPQATATTNCGPYQTAGVNGPDRVAQNGYDEAGRLTSVTTGVGTAAASMELQGYTDNGQISQVKDGNSNPTVYSYDGFDRHTTTSFANGSYEQLGYDSSSNVTSRRLRDGTTIGYGYDALNRVTSKTPPSPDYAVSYVYDLLGRVTTVSRSADGVSHGFTYDALSRLRSETQPFGSVSYLYDAASRRTRLTWSDGNYVTYEYLATGEVSAIRENGSGLLASYGYDSLGRRASLTRGNGTVTSYGYDAVSRLASLTHDLGGTAYDVSTSFSYNPAGQIASQTRSNDAYAWNGAVNVDRSYGVNALNQLTSAGSTSLGYDARGNLTSSGSSSFTYSSENLMKTAPGVSMYYDALGRLHEYDTSVSTRFVYDGSHIAAETANPSGAIQRRYVFGPGDDEPLVWYEGGGLSDRRWLVGDERGSVVATTDGSGIVTGVNSYDEYGIPASGNIGRFQYTGQAWLPELGMSYYKARIYSPSLGRFMQTDPIGYGDGLNWYNHVKSDPINGRDPTGTQCVWDDGTFDSLEGADSVRTSGDCSGAGGTWVDPQAFANAGLSPGAWTNDPSLSSWSNGPGSNLTVSTDLIANPENANQITVTGQATGQVFLLDGLQKDTSFSHCTAIAAWAHKGQIAVDALSAVPVGKAAALAGRGLSATANGAVAFAQWHMSVGSGVYSLANHDYVGAAGGAAGYTAVIADLAKEGTTFIPVVGTLVGAFSVYNDVYGSEEYAACREGK